MRVKALLPFPLHLRFETILQRRAYSTSAIPLFLNWRLEPWEFTMAKPAFKWLIIANAIIGVSALGRSLAVSFHNCDRDPRSRSRRHRVPSAAPSYPCDRGGCYKPCSG